MTANEFFQDFDEQHIAKGIHGGTLIPVQLRYQSGELRILGWEFIVALAESLEFVPGSGSSIRVTKGGLENTNHIFQIIQCNGVDIVSDVRDEFFHGATLQLADCIGNVVSSGGVASNVTEELDS